MLHEKRDARLLTFLVLVDDNDRLCVVGHGLIDEGSLVGGVLDATEELLDLSLGLVDIDVTDDDNSLVIGVIPFVVIVDELLTLEVVDDGHQTNRITSSVLRARVEFLEVTLEHTALCGSTETPLLVDDAALFVDLALLQGEAAGPVAEDEQTGVECGDRVCRHVVNVVHCLVDGGVGIEVTTELDALRAAPLDEVIAFEMVGTIESHVLKEVSETALVLVLFKGAHFLGDVEVGTMLRPVVVADDVSQSVGKLTDAESCVHRNRHVRHLRADCCDSREQKQQRDDDVLHVHHRFNYSII